MELGDYVSPQLCHALLRGIARPTLLYDHAHGGLGVQTRLGQQLGLHR